jgi:hypothetical protein
VKPATAAMRPGDDGRGTSIAASVRAYADRLRAYRSRLEFFPQQHERADGMVEAAEEIAGWLETLDRTS